MSGQQNSDANKGIFLNGKGQIIEMLQQMEGAAKEKLLKNISVRNPTMARELEERSFSFNSLVNLSNHQLRLITSNLNSQILGIALKGCHPQLQRKILSVAPREYAEEAYEILVGRFKNDQKDILRAQEKVLAVVVTLMRRKQITWN